MKEPNKPSGRDLDLQNIYDEEDFYDDEIYPLVSQILDKCRQKQIPCLMTFAYSNVEVVGEEEGTTSSFATSTVGRTVNGVDPSDRSWAPLPLIIAHRVLTEKFQPVDHR